ncbi:hypothetical protein Mapa_008906 [Marchantia paleacea]|nr:hypothetical protein Mapa_008906 [Marchantia paleacea]
MSAKWILIATVALFLAVPRVDGQAAPAPGPALTRVNTTFTESDFYRTKCFPMGSKKASQLGMIVAGIGEPYFRDGAACGSEINVRCVADAEHPWDTRTCTGGSVNVTIVDKCEHNPPCLNLHLNAFQLIGTRNISGFIIADFYEVSAGTGIVWTPEQ